MGLLSLCVLFAARLLSQSLGPPALSQVLQTPLLEVDALSLVGQSCRGLQVGDYRRHRARCSSHYRLFEVLALFSAQAQVRQAAPAQ